MRILFSTFPAFGHLLPLVPLARAARADGHDVAVMTSLGMAEILNSELPGVELVGAGPMPSAVFDEVARRLPGVNPLHDPRPEAVAEFFAGARVDLGADAAIEAAAAWQPDVVVYGAIDFIGPLAAARVGVPGAMLAYGPRIPQEFMAPMVSVVALRYDARAITMLPPIAIIDPTPALLQAPDWEADSLVVPVRPAPHRREIPPVPMRPFESAVGTPRVLVTLGTVFADDKLLLDIIASIRSLDLDVEVLATVGVLPDANLPDDDQRVHYERFRPMAELLDGVDVVVSAGGAGTVLAALSEGVPLVLMPQGADQFLNAERATAAGAAIVLDHPQDVGAAVARALRDTTMRAAAQSIRTASEARPNPSEAVAELVRRVLALSR